tara:strand:- start:1267 stop:1515 length:249 start_codon:yes stop_codon:yes gene_type:complete
MAYKVYVEVVPRPNNVEEWMWNQVDEDRGTPQNGHGDYKNHVGGYAWQATGSSYVSSSDANTKRDELQTLDTSNRRYKVLEV